MIWVALAQAQETKRKGGEFAKRLRANRERPPDIQKTPPKSPGDILVKGEREEGLLKLSQTAEEEEEDSSLSENESDDFNENGEND